MLQASILVFCETQSRAQLLRPYSVTRSNLQKDGATLLQPSMVRYVEGVFNVVRSIMDARQASGSEVNNNQNNPNWADSSVVILIMSLTQTNMFHMSNIT